MSQLDKEFVEAIERDDFRDRQRERFLGPELNSPLAEAILQGLGVPEYILDDVLHRPASLPANIATMSGAGFA